MLDIFKKLSYLLNRREKIQVIGLFGLLLIGSSLEMLGVGFVVPFISYLSEPELITEQPILNGLYQLLGTPAETTFLVILCLIYLAIYTGKNVYTAGMYYLQHRFIFNKERKVGDKLFQEYLGAPYTFHLERNTATLIRNVDAEVRKLFTGVLIPLVMLITELTVITGLVILLITIEPIASLVAVVVLGGAGFVFYRIFQKRLLVAGKARQYHQGQVIQHINQGLGGVKETKVLGREAFFLKRHSVHRKQLAQAFQFNQTLNQLPRLYFETLIIYGLLGIVLVTILQGSTAGGVFQTVSLFAAAALRLMPSLNRTIQSLNKVRFGSPSLDLVCYELKRLEDEKNLLKVAEEELPTLQESLRLEEVSYHYPNSEEQVLNQVSIEILQGTSVGFVGSSGAGKTTLVDIILGLLRPTSGKVVVDGVDIQQGLRGWQNQIGYIPQSIYLSDETLRGNIAFGIPEKEISEEQVWQAVQSAQLQELVERLPQGLDTVVGERGVRLSGGQRQRVGIARALYHNPQVLVMDEATAALDNETEAGLMEAVEKLSGEKTLIMIAHRLTTVKNCDCLYFMEGGKVVDQGSYNELRDQNENFMKMAGSN